MTTVVCIADDITWHAAMQALANSDIRCLDWSTFDQDSLRFANASCVGVAKMDANSAELTQRLGRLCRAFPAGVVVEWVGSEPASDEQFFAHGFKKMLCPSDDLLSADESANLSLGTAQLYEYRLQNYKTVPDWLNARYWAHPERYHL